MKMTIMKIGILRQSIIFFVYLFALSLILFSHKGGEDIAFMFLMIISVCVHVLIILINIVLNVDKETKSITMYDFFTVLTLVTLFILFSSKYLSFIWWLTNLFKS